MLINSHDYYSADTEQFSPVFSDVPDMKLDATATHGSDTVSIRAEITNQAQHRDAYTPGRASRSPPAGTTTVCRRAAPTPSRCVATWAT